MQEVYAYLQRRDFNLPLAEKELLKSFEKLYDLFIYQLSFLAEIFDFAQLRAEEAKQKFLPTEEDLNPDTRLIDNRLIDLITKNKEYSFHVNRLKISWNDEKEMIRRILNDFRNNDEYKLFISSKNDSFNADKKILMDLFRGYVASNESLEGFYEAESMYWANDYPVVTSNIIKCLGGIKEGWNEDDHIPIFYTSPADKNEDKEFALTLFRKTILHRDEFEQIIGEKAVNWDLERIALMDMIILEMAITEILEFPTIPVKVSFNEYIEISKSYSTPKSKVFINGILDKLILDLKENNQIKKTGRGLVE